MNKPVTSADLVTPKVTTGPLPASRKVYSRAGRRARPARAAARDRADRRSGEPPLPVYDTTGPYTDGTSTIDVEKGLARTRIEWVKERGGVEEYEGRPIQPVDNGNATGKYLARNFPNTPKPWRALDGKPVTQYEFAKRRRHHQGNDLRRRARESRPQEDAGSRARPRWPTASSSAARCPRSSRRNSCATRSRAAAPSSRPTSTTPNSSR